MLTNIERYTRGLAQCRANADTSQHIEVSQIWMSIASSYLFLLEREKRLDEERIQQARWASCLS